MEWELQQSLFLSRVRVLAVQRLAISLAGQLMEAWSARWTLFP
jgi:hypothetical protein